MKLSLNDMSRLLALTISCIILFAPSYHLFAQSYDFGSQSGLNKAADTAGFVTDQTASTVEDIISTIIYAVLGLLGVIFLSLILYGGFTWMTADGNEERVKKANKIVMGALLGLIITIAAYAISYFFLNYFWK